MPNPLPRKLDFLPHVEGMRALAILLVVAAHAGVPGMAGGIVGVDIFFVISGYLISALLTIEAVNPGGARISFSGFYARRLRRLLPALLLVLTATGLMAALLTPRSTYPESALAGASAAAWLANLYFAFAQVDYFSTNTNGNPFLHMWSLGVEEQFYLLWPLLIAWIAIRAKEAQQIVKHLKLAFSIVLALGLIAFLWLSVSPYALQAYYLMPVRAWQFALGGLAWLVGLHRQETQSGICHPIIFISTGFVAIIVATYSPDTFAANTALRALSASVGATLLLIGGSYPKAGQFLRLLTIPPVLAVGRVSYAWYLWHWPMLVFGQIYFSDADLIIRLLLVMLAWALAVFTQQFVEVPFRTWSNLVVRPGRVIIISLLAMTISAAAFLRWHQSAQAWVIAQTEKNRYLAVRWDVPKIYSHRCDDWYHSADLKICEFGAAQGKHTVVVMGDSVGLHWFPAFEAVFSEHGWRILVITKSSCPMVDEPVYYPRIKRFFTECAEWRQKAVKAIADIRPDMVLLGSSFGYDFDATQWTKGSRRLFQQLAPVARRVYVIRATPTLPFDSIDCLSERVPLSTTEQANCVVKWDDTEDSVVWRRIREAAQGLSNVELLDLNDLVCPNKICAAERDGLVVFRDRLHITANFSASLAKAVGTRMTIPINRTESTSGRLPK